MYRKYRSGKPFSSIKLGGHCQIRLHSLPPLGFDNSGAGKKEKFGGMCVCEREIINGDVRGNMGKCFKFVLYVK